MAEGKYGSGTGTHTYYVVEARSTFEPQEINGVLLTKDWRRLPVTVLPRVSVGVGAGAITVPACGYADVDAARMGLLQREAAYALAVRFMVDSGEAHHGFGAGRAHLCVEARLVEVKLQYSFAVSEVGVCEPFSLSESLRYLKSTPREQAVAKDSAARTSES